MSREAMELALEALESDPISHAGLVNRKQAITALRQSLSKRNRAMDKGYYCVVCGKYIEAVDDVIVHDDIPHPVDMAFDEEKNPQ